MKTRYKIEPPKLSTSAPPPVFNDERPFVDDGLWTGVTWGAIVTLAVGGIIILILAALL